MTPEFDGVLFDIDDTICEYRRSGEELLSLAFERAGVEPFFTAEEYYGRHWRFTEASDSVEELRQRCFAALAEERGRDPETGRAVAKVYAAERDHANVRFLPGAAEALDALAGTYTLGAVTNGDPGMQSTKLDALGVDCFETVVHAGYDAPPKPEAEPFHAALDALDLDRGRTLFVGNSLAADVAGAHNAGLRVAWLADGTEDPQPEPEYTLDSAGDLRALLEG